MKTGFFTPAHEARRDDRHGSTTALLPQSSGTTDALTHTAGRFTTGYYWTPETHLEGKSAEVMADVWNEKYFLFSLEGRFLCIPNPNAELIEHIHPTRLKLPLIYSK